MMELRYDDDLLPRVKEILAANSAKLIEIAAERNLAGLRFQVIRTYPGEPYHDAAAVVSEKPGFEFEDGHASLVLREMIDQMHQTTGLSFELGFSSFGEVPKNF